MNGMTAIVCEPSLSPDMFIPGCTGGTGQRQGPGTGPFDSTAQDSSTHLARKWCSPLGT